MGTEPTKDYVVKAVEWVKTHKSIVAFIILGGLILMALNAIVPAVAK